MNDIFAKQNVPNYSTTETVSTVTLLQMLYSKQQQQQSLLRSNFMDLKRFIVQEMS